VELVNFKGDPLCLSAGKWIYTEPGRRIKKKGRTETKGRKKEGWGGMYLAIFLRNRKELLPAL